MEAKRLNFEKTPFSFEANGHTYHSTQTVCIDRFIELERLQAHVGFGKDFMYIYNKLKDAYDNMNKNKLADSAVIIHNLLNGIGQNLDKRDHPALRLCALFVNRDDEDATVLDEDLMDAKIEDWRKEGYNISDFFQLATRSVNGFYDALEEITQNISEVEEQVAKNIGKSE